MADNNKKVHRFLPTLFEDDESLKNVQIQDISNDGQTISALDIETGQVLDFDRQELNDYYSAELGPNEELKLQLNTIETATEVSPLTVMERREFSFSDKRGKGLLRQLKQSYGKDNVSSNKEGQIVINNGGVWQKFDPESSISSYIKDPLELTKDLNDLYKTGIQVTSAIIGGALGGLSAGPPGVIIGATAATGLSESILTSWGRAQSVYEATPEEQAEDIGSEMLMVFGGEAIAPGLTKGAQSVVKATKNLGTKLSKGSRDLLTSVIGQITKAGKPAAETMIDQGAKVTRRMKGLAKGAANSEEVAFRAEEAAVDNMTELLTKAKKALPAKYGSLLEEMVEKAGEKNVTVHPQEIIESISKELEEAGFGKLVQRKAKEVGDIPQRGIREQLGLLPKPKAGKLEFVPLSPSEQLARATTQEGGKVLINEEIKFINQHLMPQIELLSKVKVLKGKGAARFLSNIRKNLNAFARQEIKGSTPQAQMVTSKLNNAFSGSITKQFERMGLGNEIAEMTGLYTKYGDAVAVGRKILAGEGEEATVRKVSGNATRQWVALKRNLSKMVELTGDDGAKLMDDIEILNAVKGFSSMAPKLGLVQSVAIGSAALGPQGKLIGGGILAASSGKLSGAVLAAEHPIINAGVMITNHVGNLSNASLKHLVGNEALMRATILTPLLMAAQEDAAAEELLAPVMEHSRIR